MQPVGVKNYLAIEKAIEEEAVRVGATSANKVQHLTSALDRLYACVIIKYPDFRYEKRRDIKAILIDEVAASRVDLKSLSAMLEAQIFEWDMRADGLESGFVQKLSLKQALNIANLNVFNITGTMGPLWGETSSLQNVKKKLDLS